MYYLYFLFLVQLLPNLFSNSNRIDIWQHHRPYYEEGPHCYDVTIT